MSLYTRIIDLQKLGLAWDNVRKNKPASGVDNVTCECFEENRRAELKQLQMELANHTYETLPVRQVVLYKGEKSRTIALYSMRDKVVQQSLAQELSRMYEDSFSENTYAYRRGRSALEGLNRVEEAVKSGKWNYVLKLDIRHFFDSIAWKQLENKLRTRIQEDDVMDLIRQNAVTRVLEEGGELKSRTVGIHQGSAIAPILSNIYMMGFDGWAGQADVFFMRYSDDMLFLGSTQEQMMQLLEQIRGRLGLLELQLNEEKTVFCPLEDHFEFLGHAFSREGKAIPHKAEAGLQERLEDTWIKPGLNVKQKIEKSAEIVGGWEQYFTEKRDIGSIFEFTAMVGSNKRIGAEKDKEVSLDDLKNIRQEVKNEYRDIAVYLAEFWRSNSCSIMELGEYEEYYQMPQRCREENIQGNALDELLGFYRRHTICETEETGTEIMQIYTDLGAYENAEAWMKIREDLQSQSDPGRPLVAENNSDEKTIVNEETARRILRMFAGREDVYSLETLGYGGKRQTELQLQPLTEQVVSDHLQGGHTVGTYIQRPNSTVRWIVLDVDVSKKILLQYDRSTPEFREYMALAFQKANEYLKLYRQWGMKGYLENSGCRGYHVWLLFTEWIPVRYANMFCELLERKVPSVDGITVEYFPNKTRIKPGKYGQCLKLPYGRHSRTGEISYFLDDYGEKVIDINGFLDSMARYPLSAVKKVLAANTEYTDHGTQTLELDEQAFGQLPDSVHAVLENCNLMKYLCQKAQKTGYLSHFERLSILYVFGHLGEEGREFIHTVMGMTLNYQYQTTEKFIQKIPDKPISCVKLRDQYKSVTAEYGCSCSFKRTKNCYPSPVLHAISLSNDASSQITIPTSRTLTKESEQKVIDEMNIHKKAEELAGKILEMKKQRRKLDRSVEKVETELEKLFDSQGIDCLEIEMGLLVRRKKEKGYEWVIEI